MVFVRQPNCSTLILTYFWSKRRSVTTNLGTNPTPSSLPLSTRSTVMHLHPEKHILVQLVCKLPRRDKWDPLSPKPIFLRQLDHSNETGIAVCKTKIIAIVNSEEIWESHHPVTLFIFQKQRGEGKGTEGKGEGTEGQWTIVIMLFLSNIYFFACIRMNVWMFARGHEVHWDTCKGRWMLESINWWVDRC